MYSNKLDDWVAEQYRQRGYFVQKHQDYLLLRFVEDAPRPHAIIKCVDRDTPLSSKEVFAMFTDFEHLRVSEKPCFQYRIICPAGFEEGCNDFLRYNVSLSDASYLKEIAQKDYVYLFAHNELMCKNIREALKSSLRVAAVQATGSGKSLLIAAMAKDIAGSRQLIVVPRRNIIAEIQRQLPKGMRNIHFETYQHLCQMTKEELAKLSFSRVYLDEFHHMGATKWSKAVNVLLDQNPKAQVLGTTATTQHISSKEGRRDMSRLVFDQTAGEMPLEEALVRHVLTTPRYVCMPSSYADVKERLLSRPDIAKSPEKRAKITQMVDEMAVKQPVHEILAKHLPAGAGRMLVFSSTVTELKRNKRLVSDLLRKAGFTLDPYIYYHSANDQKTAKGLDEMLKHRPTRRMQVLFCVDMLNEGVHVPDVTAAIFLRRTESDTLFKQQLGRLMDAASTHQTVVFDMVDNIFNRNIQDIAHSVDEAMKRKTEQMKHYLGFYQERHPVKFEIDDYNEAIRQQEHKIAGPERVSKRRTLADRLDELASRYPCRGTDGFLAIPALDPAAKQDYEFLYAVVQRYNEHKLSDMDMMAVNDRRAWIDLEMDPLYTVQLKAMIDDYNRNRSQNIEVTYKKCFKELSKRILKGELTPKEFGMLSNSRFMDSWRMKLDRDARIVFKAIENGRLQLGQDTAPYLKLKEKEALAKQRAEARKQAKTKGLEQKGNEPARSMIVEAKPASKLERTGVRRRKM